VQESKNNFMGTFYGVKTNTKNLNLSMDENYFSKKLTNLNEKLNSHVSSRFSPKFNLKKKEINYKF